MKTREQRAFWAAVLALTAAVPATAAQRIVRRTARVADAQPVEAPADVALLGVTQVGDVTRVLLMDLRTRRRETAVVGGAAFGFNVKRIGTESVVLSRGGKEFTLRMGDKPLPPAAGAPAPTPVVPGVLPLPLPGPRRGFSPGLAPEEELPLPTEPLPETAPPPAGQPQVAPSPLPPAPEPPAPYGYPGYVFDPYSGQYYGYPGAGYGYPGAGYGYPGAFPGYYPADPYSGYYYGYPYPMEGGYAPYGSTAPGSTGLSAPWGAYPNRSGTGPASGGLRWNPQTRRRAPVDPYQGTSYTNPQTRRRRGY